MAYLSTLRENRPKMFEGVTPWVLTPKKDEAYLVNGIIVPCQLYTDGSKIRISIVSGDGFLKPLTTKAMFSWPVADAVARSKRFDQAIETQEVVDALKGEGIGCNPELVHGAMAHLRVGHIVPVPVFAFRWTSDGVGRNPHVSEQLKVDICNQDGEALNDCLRFRLMTVARKPLP